MYHSEQLNPALGYMFADDDPFSFEGCAVAIEGALLELNVGGLVTYNKDRVDQDGKHVPMDNGKLARWKKGHTIQSVSHPEQTSIRRVFFKFCIDQKELLEHSRAAYFQLD